MFTNLGFVLPCFRALDDIQASIRELESYRKHIFIPPSSDSVKPDHHLDAGQNRAGFSIDSSSQGSLTNDQSTGSLLLSSCVHRILHDSSWFPAIVGLWLVAEAGLCGVIIEKIPCKCLGSVFSPQAGETETGR